MKKFLTDLVLIALALFTVFSMTACDTKRQKKDDDRAYRTAPPQPVELGGSVTLSTYRTSDNDSSAFLFIENFTSQYPGVEVTNDNELTYEEYFATLDERVADGSIGDVFVVDSDRLARYVEAGYVRDLSPYLNGLIEYTSGQYKKLYPDSIFYNAAYLDSVYKNKMYLVPTEYENKAVIVNIDKFTAAGLSVPADRWTWDDVLEYAKLLKESGCEYPVALDYADFSVWGSFAMSRGAEVFKKVDGQADTVLNLTDPKVVTGLKFLAEEFIATGLVSETRPCDIAPSDLSKYGIIVISHNDLSDWAGELASGSFNWEFAHYPRFSKESDGANEEFYYNIGVKTLGLAVRVREYDTEDYDEEEIRMMDEIGVQLALYAMVPEASVSISGSNGVRVPASMFANSKKFWRDYPVSGKNTSVFSLYSEFDYPATMTVYTVLDAADEITDHVGSAIKDYASDRSVSLDERLQEIQNHAEANR